VTTGTIAIVLPPREKFRAADAGAVALTVKDFVEGSRYRERITVIGGEPGSFPGINYRRVPARLSWLLGKNIAYALAVAFFLKKSDAAVVEVHNRVALALALKRALPARQVSLHIHNAPAIVTGAETPARRQRILQKLDRLYCVSAWIRERFCDDLTAPDQSKFTVVYNAIPATELSPEKTRRDWVVYAGRFIPEKGVLELAQALTRVLPDYPGWRAVFLGAWGFGHPAGRSGYEQQVYATLEQIADRVEFRGHVPHADVMAAFAEAAVAVMPSTGVEAFGRTALEAMEAGCAVVSSVMGGLSEVAGAAAVRVDPVTAAALEQALRDLLGNDAERRAVAARCRQWAGEAFDLAVQIAILDAARQPFLES
jgi:glycosyltransferase involved in cell wall biosynthesis